MRANLAKPNFTTEVDQTAAEEGSEGRGGEREEDSQGEEGGLNLVWQVTMKSAVCVIFYLKRERKSDEGKREAEGRNKVEGI